jgi:3'-phosphoadenosine 5'-phosphosulfate sulfotransferase (PAPS reductase)/FAD synthetase
MAALIESRKGWPRGGGGKFQFCTQNLKQAPALAWLDAIDPSKDLDCYVGIRRAESANRAQFPLYTEESPRHGGRSLYAPLALHSDIERNALVARTPLALLPFRSKECYPCVNARKQEIANLPESRIALIESLETSAGINSKGNARVMFSPTRYGGAIGIRAVVEQCKHGTDDLFGATPCDSGYCGD